MQVIPRFIILLVFALLMTESPAQDDRDAQRAAFEACLVENNLARPEPGIRPSEGDREKLQACMSGKGFTRTKRNDEFHQAIKACASENNIVFAEGSRPSESDRQIIDTCLQSKGIEKPQRMGRRSGGSRASAQ